MAFKVCLILNIKNKNYLVYTKINCFEYQEGKLDDTWFPQVDNVTVEGTGSYVETWKAMEKLVQKGLVKSIGVSNFNKKQIEDVISVATVKPVTNQVYILTIDLSV